MKQVKLHKLMDIENVSDILTHFDVEELDEIDKRDMLDYLMDEFGEPEPDEDNLEDTFDLIDDDSFLDDRVDEEDDEYGHLLIYTDESVVWKYFSISEGNSEE